jgi:hypothetical protein
VITRGGAGEVRALRDARDADAVGQWRQPSVRAPERTRIDNFADAAAARPLAAALAPPAARRTAVLAAVLDE